MKTSSAKAKGRKLQQWVASQISKVTGIPWGKDELIASREMGQTGVDIRLIGEALEKFPFSVECKRCEKLSIQSWIKQAKENKLPNTDWLLIFRRSNEKAMIVMEAERFFMMIDRGDLCTDGKMKRKREPKSNYHKFLDEVGRKK